MILELIGNSYMVNVGGSRIEVCREFIEEDEVANLNHWDIEYQYV